MIGQKNILNTLKTTNFNSLNILVGENGSGKKTLLKEVFAGKNYCLLQDTKKDKIKEIIDMAYKVNSPMVYIIADVDDMSNAAMNSLLKVTEEPPNNAIFILTCCNLDNILPTLRSRAFIYYMEQYSPKEIREYYGKEENSKIVSTLCKTPGEVNKLVSNGVEEFNKYVELVFENIKKVSLSNALKIGNKISFKEEQEGFDLKLFFRAYNLMCLSKMLNKDEYEYYGDEIEFTSKMIRYLSIKGINKSSLFDTWVLNIRMIGGVD